MNISKKISLTGSAPLFALICLLSFAAGPAWGASYFLQAGVATFPAGTFNNPTDITMWGYARCTRNWVCGAVRVPGPILTATEGEPLTISVRNAISGPYVEPTSVIIPGQPSGELTPTWTDGTTGDRTALTQRVRSFTKETPADGATVVTYRWPGVKAGTYLYQSGTHPAVQVQMGLYGALKVYAVAPVAPATSGQAYDDPTSAFDREAVLLFSEIDPVLHDAVATGAYGVTMTSTVDYHPRYFLINGLPNTSTTRAGVIRVQTGLSGQNVLLRFLNAGLEPKIPTVKGPFMSVIAEDGNFMTAIDTTGITIPAPKQQYSVLLPPGKTMDAIMTNPATPGLIPLFDRRLNLSNAGSPFGGMLVYLRNL